MRPYSTEPAVRPLITLRPNPRPFNFQEKWSDPTWKRCGVYLWSIEHNEHYLTSYVGQVIGTRRNFDSRIWEECKWWACGRDHAVDIELYKHGVRKELGSYPPGHLEAELRELRPLIRWWLIPLSTEDECDEIERWLVERLCQDSRTKQFLANRNPDRYRSRGTHDVAIECSAEFRILGLTTSADAYTPDAT